MSDDLKTINEQLGRMEGTQRQMKEKQQQIKQAVLETNQTVRQNTLDIATIQQAVLENNEIIKRMEKVQSEQHKIIELLSSRSIEQEAEIKRIK